MFIAVLAAALAAPAPAARAQGASAFPNRPVTLIVPYAAGVSADLLFRSLAEVASKHLGQPIVVDNRAGGSGTLGPAQMAANAKPDGYTVSQLALPVFRLPLMQKTTYDPLKDFSYVIVVANYQVGAVVNAESPYKKWQDVVDYAKANPGKFAYSTLGAGTTPNMAIEVISRQEGVQMTHIPSKGGGEGIASVLGNHVQMIVESPAWAPMVQAGKLRLLMVLGAEREKAWPDVPTIKELGYPFTFESPTGIAGPKGMDPAVVKKLHDAFQKAMDDPKAVDIYRKMLFTPHYKDSAGFTELARKLVAEERELLTRLNLLKKE